MAWTSQADSLELGPSQCPPGLPAHGHPGGGLTELFPNFIPKEKTPHWGSPGGAQEQRLSAQWARLRGVGLMHFYLKNTYITQVGFSFVETFTTNIPRHSVEEADMSTLVTLRLPQSCDQQNIQHEAAYVTARAVCLFDFRRVRCSPVQVQSAMAGSGLASQLCSWSPLGHMMAAVAPHITSSPSKGSEWRAVSDLHSSLKWEEWHLQKHLSHPPPTADFPSHLLPKTGSAHPLQGQELSTNG